VLKIKQLAARDQFNCTITESRLHMLQAFHTNGNHLLTDITS